MRVGISTWSLGANTIDALRLISRTEFKYVELWYYNDLVGSERAILDYFSSYNITPWSLHAPFGRELDISHLDVSVRRKSIREILKSMDVAHRYGCKYIVVHPSANFYDDLKSYEDSRRALIESLSELERQASNLGVCILIENMLSKPNSHRVGVTVREILEVISEGGFESVGICLDTGHSNYNSLNPSEEALIAGKYLNSIHLNDNDGTSDSHKVPGEGTIDWREFASALRQVRYKGILMLEVYGGREPESVLQRATVAITRLFSN